MEALSNPASVSSSIIASKGPMGFLRQYIRSVFKRASRGFEIVRFNMRACFVPLLKAV
jgi:hypothetical protein